MLASCRSPAGRSSPKAADPCGVFAVDLLIRVALGERRRHDVVKHWLDVLIIILPLLRPLRLLRLVTLLKVLNHRATTGLRGRVAVYVAGGSALLAFCGGLAVLDVERDHGGNVATFGDAKWWAVTTMTTVRYGRSSTSRQRSRSRSRDLQQQLDEVQSQLAMVLSRLPRAALDDQPDPPR